MSNHWEYCTLEDIRAAKMPRETALVAGTGDGTFLLGLIREVGGIINACAGRQFAPTVATRYYHAENDVDGADLILDKDLLSITTVTNGDATVVTAGQRTTLPKNLTPYYRISLLSSAGLSWTYNTDPEDSISIAGIWGWHDDYANAWESLTTLGAAISSTSATSATLAAAVGNPGELWKIDSEFLYLSARTTTTATIVRGVNGSTAATHSNGATITRWCLTSNQYGAAAIPKLCRDAVVCIYNIRENPRGGTFVLDNQTVVRESEVDAIIENKILRLGLKRQ